MASPLNPRAGRPHPNPPQAGEGEDAPAGALGGHGRGRVLVGVLPIVAVVLVLVIALAFQRYSAPPSEMASTASAPQGLKYATRGQIHPVSQARIRALSSGVGTSLSVNVGDAVGDQQEIARIRGPASTEVVTASLRGTVTSLPVHLGDTVMAGSLVATVGDLSRLQVETTDVDEFLISAVRRGQPAIVLVEALGRELQGQVRTVSLEPTITATGDEHYVVTIDLLESPAELRPGMNVRLRFVQ